MEWINVETPPKLFGCYLLAFEELNLAGKPYMSTAWWINDVDQTPFWKIDAHSMRDFTPTHWALPEPPK